VKENIEDGDEVFFGGKTFHSVETSVPTPAAFEGKEFKLVETSVLTPSVLEDSMVSVTALLEALLGTLPTWVHSKYLMILVYLPQSEQ
jgi:hypothetical protein